MYFMRAMTHIAHLGSVYFEESSSHGTHSNIPLFVLSNCTMTQVRLCMGTLYVPPEAPLSYCLSYPTISWHGIYESMVLSNDPYYTFYSCPTQVQRIYCENNKFSNFPGKCLVLKYSSLVQLQQNKLTKHFSAI